MQLKIGKMTLQTIYVDANHIIHKTMVLAINVELDAQNVIKLNV